MQHSPSDSPGRIFAKYGPPPNVFDEAFFPNGEMRSTWRALVEPLDAMSLTELRHRWQQAQSQIERDGVIFNPHEDDAAESRPWTLDAIPMVLANAEWEPLAAQLSQRARVLEALLSDLFGEQRLLRDKVLPPELLFGHPGWYPAYQGLNAAGNRYLTYCITDLARGANGTWRATGDRTRAPFGIGYVLENRIATSRMLSSIFRRLPVKRLAGFYATLKQQLHNLAPNSQENPRIVLWTDGPQQRGFFEDAYLARYLGYTLVEGDDLAVRDDRVQMLTLGGLLPVEVMLRRMDDEDCDSVELDPTSRNGVSSLLEVVRSGRVAVANQIGSRLAESPAFLPFLPAVSEHLLGEPLLLRTAPTWWCGEPAALSHVQAHLDKMIIRSAFRMSDEPPIVGARLSAADRDSLQRRICNSPSDFVGQEVADRSTTPVLTETGVEPWFVGMRSFLVSDGADQFRVLPGGLARVSPDSASLNFTMTAGERSQDVWVLDDKPVEAMTLLESNKTRIEPKRSGAELPSRVADNLFWLGRYSERAARTARLLRTLFASIESEDTDRPENEPLLRILAHQGQVDPDHLVPELSRSFSDLAVTLPAAVLDPKRPMSLRSSVHNAVRTAMRVRDRISQEMWRSIDRLNTQFLQSARLGNPAVVDMGVLLENSLVDVTAFAGLVDDGMTRALGWRFLDLGRRIERCGLNCLLLRCFFADYKSDDVDTLEAALTATDSLITYRSRYLANFQTPVVLDLLMTDATNPRSMIYQLERIMEHLDAMPGEAERGIISPERRLAISMTNSVRLADIYNVCEPASNQTRPKLQRLLARLESRLPKLSDTITSRYLTHAGLPRHFANSP